MYNRKAINNDNIESVLINFNSKGNVNTDGLRKNGKLSYTGRIGAWLRRYKCSIAAVVGAAVLAPLTGGASLAAYVGASAVSITNVVYSASRDTNRQLYYLTRTKGVGKVKVSGKKLHKMGIEAIGNEQISNSKFKWYTLNRNDWDGDITVSGHGIDANLDQAETTKIIKYSNYKQHNSLFKKRVAFESQADRIRNAIRWGANIKYSSDTTINDDYAQNIIKTLTAQCLRHYSSKKGSSFMSNHKKALYESEVLIPGQTKYDPRLATQTTNGQPQSNNWTPAKTKAFIANPTPTPQQQAQQTQQATVPNPAPAPGGPTLVDISGYTRPMYDGWFIEMKDLVNEFNDDATIDSRKSEIKTKLRKYNDTLFVLESQDSATYGSDYTTNWNNVVSTIIRSP